MFPETRFYTKPDIGMKELQKEELFNSNSKSTYKEYIQKVTEYLVDFLDKDRFYSGESSSNLRKKPGLAISNSSRRLTIDEALQEIKELYLDHTISFQHPMYAAHLNCPVLLSALVGDFIATSVNTAVETWDQSTSATLIEQKIVDWMCRVLKLPFSSDGVFTSGGTQSNLMALCIARDHYAYTHFGIHVKQNGWAEELSRFRIFCSEKAHFSIQKNAALLGLGCRAVIPVETDSKMKMNPNALVFAMEKEVQKGNIPIAIVATVGTTDFGSFDPLKELVSIAKETGVWLHVDGAYGGCYALTNTHKELFKGIEYADSVTVDFHKTMFQPLCSSAFLVRNKDCFQYISHYADYLNPVDSRESQEPNLIEKSMQTTRRFDALKLWFTLKMTGEKTIASFLEKIHHLALDLYHKIIEDSCFEVLHKPELSTLVFRYKRRGITGDTMHDRINKYIKTSLFASGKASVASTKCNGAVYLKCTLLNPRTTLEDLLHIVAMIKEKGEEYNIQKQCTQ